MDLIPIHICETTSDSKKICEESLKKFLKGVEIWPLKTLVIWTFFCTFAVV